jgi:hypothetical protein
VVWRECISCGGLYLPSVTSDDRECGVCYPVKDKSLIVRSSIADLPGKHILEDAKVVFKFDS